MTRICAAAICLLLPAWAWAAGSRPADPQEEQARAHLAEFARRWRAAWDRNRTHDENDSAQADTVIFLSSVRHRLVRDQLLAILRDHRSGPQVVSACARMLTAYSDDEVVADAILETLETIYRRRMDDRLRERFEVQVPAILQNLGLMDRRVLRPRVQRLHPFIHGERPRTPNIAVQKTALELLGHIRAAESIPPMLDLMLALQAEMREHLQRAAMRGSGGCDGG